jgi:hypothetical protein
MPANPNSCGIYTLIQVFSLIPNGFWAGEMDILNHSMRKEMPNIVICLPNCGLRCPFEIQRDRGNLFGHDLADHPHHCGWRMCILRKRKGYDFKRLEAEI